MFEGMKRQCTKCPASQRREAIASMKVRRADGSLEMFCVCREHGFEEQKRAAQAGDTVEWEEFH